MTVCSFGRFAAQLSHHIPSSWQRYPGQTNLHQARSPKSFPLAILKPAYVVRFPRYILVERAASQCFSPPEDTTPSCAQHTPGSAAGLFWVSQTPVALGL